MLTANHDNNSYTIDSNLIAELLKDRTTNKNIIWGTNNYSSRGYKSTDQIPVDILLRKRKVIKPRIEKSKTEQQKRSKDKAEVFTPSWVCNKQNNLVDIAWLGGYNPFNEEKDNSWTTKTDKIDFSKSSKTWQDYVLDLRLEITCGEAPYLVSRYDTVSGKFIPAENRIGVLDRKLRVVNENTEAKEDWLEWTKKAYQSVYGYEYQGDNLVIARENLLFTFIDNYRLRFNELPDEETLKDIINIITWNIFQMDGLKYVVPESCKNVKGNQYTMTNLFGEEKIFGEPEKRCTGCVKNNPYEHNGKYCYIMDWTKNKKVKFLSLLKGV